MILICPICAKEGIKSKVYPNIVLEPGYFDEAGKWIAGEGIHFKSSPNKGNYTCSNCHEFNDYRFTYINNHSCVRSKEYKAGFSQRQNKKDILLFYYNGLYKKDFYQNKQFEFTITPEEIKKFMKKTLWNRIYDKFRR